MPRYVFKQPNGNIGIWSTIVDSPTVWNMNKEEYIEYRLEKFKKDLEEEAERLFNKEPNGYDFISFNELKGKFIRNMSKEEFSQFLKDCGSDLTVDDFTFEEDLEDEEEE